MCFIHPYARSMLTPTFDRATVRKKKKERKKLLTDREKLEAPTPVRFFKVLVRVTLHLENSVIVFQGKVKKKKRKKPSTVRQLTSKTHDICEALRKTGL